MKRIHPNLSCVATCCIAAALFAAGCRSTSSGVNNPFLAPDRVAPPSTRVLAPGQAQPYYQGDPLPTMQSATPATASTPAAADTAAARSASGRTLAWNAPPAGNTPPAALATPASPWGTPAQASQPLARANEAAVSVPTDSSELRFALPSPAASQASPGVASSTNGVQPMQSSAPSNNQGVALASYNAPAPSGMTSLGTQPALSPTPQAAATWQSPQVGSVSPTMPGYTQAASAGAPAMSQPYMSPTYSTVQSAQAMPTNPMAVQLRAVPSPPPQPGDPVPRIRVPGYDVPETAANDNFHARTSMR